MRRRLILAGLILASLVLLVTVGQLRWLEGRYALRSCPQLAAEGRAADDVALADAPALAHLPHAFTLPDGGAPTRALELVCGDPGNPPDAVPPDPGPMLREMAATNPAPRPGAVPLRLMTFNAALLDVWLGPVHHAESPFREQRRQVLLDRLLALDPPPDILLLQEVWLSEDADALVEEAATRGYLAASWQGRSEARRDRRRDTGGELTLVRRELVAGQPQGGHFSDDQVEAVAYRSQLPDEQAWLPSKDRFTRGWVQVRFEHELLGPVSIFNTHMHAYPQNWRWRAQAARQLGLAVEEAGQVDDLVIAGGDLNSAPWYGDDSWRLPEGQGGGAHHVGFENAISYAALLHYGGLVDLAVRGWRERPDRDVVVGRAAINDPSFYDREVFGPDGATLKEPFHACPPSMRRTPDSCASHAPATFTATDCNGLHMKQYAGTEPPARLDHLLARDPDDRIHALSTSIVLTDPEAVDVGDCRVELSDHYGLVVDLHVAPPLDWRR